jgi:hypothetical protein
MARIIAKTSDLSGEVAAKLFEMLNWGKLTYTRTGTYKVITTDVEPNELVYPEGWYYGKGAFRNKHESSTGIYDEIDMITSDGQDWGELAPYCNR